jgi:hypothetical protein
MPVQVEGLLWNGPRDYRQRATFQSELPIEPGFYAFTDSEFLRPGTVLYLGATLNLRSRVPQYDLNTLGGQVRPGAGHAGMIQIRDWQQQGKKLFVWWAPFPPLKKEKELVSALVPRYNDKLTNEVAETWGFPG